MKHYFLSSKNNLWKGWLLALFLFVVFFSLVAVSYAQGYLPEDSFQFLGNLPTFVDTGQTGEELAIRFVKNGVLIVRYLVGAVALILGVVYAVQLIFSRGNEEIIDKQKKNFVWAFTGFIVLIIAENVGKIFNPETATTSELINFDATRDQLREITSYLTWVIGSVIVLFMTVTGVRMVIFSDEEEELTNQKESLTWGLIGILVILLANRLVNAIYVVNEPDRVSPAGSEPLITQIAGVIRLILVFLGPLAIGFTIYAGIFYLMALDQEDKASKGKQMIIGGVTGVVIIYAAYALVNTIAAEPLAVALSAFA